MLARCYGSLLGGAWHEVVRRTLGQVFSRIRGRTPLSLEIQFRNNPGEPAGPDARLLAEQWQRLFCGTLRTFVGI